MKYKNIIYRSAVIIAILILSAIIGLISQSVINNLEKNNYPKPEIYKDLVEKYAYENGIPEYVVYSVIKVESDFEADYVGNDGAIGLMQMTPKLFNSITSSRLENIDNNMLYSPEINIKYGCIYLHNLYVKYGSWTEVYAAYDLDQETVDSWLNDTSLCDDNGKLVKIPDKKVNSYVNILLKTNDKYKNLY